MKIDTTKQLQIDLRKLADKWSSTIVAREKVGDFTGGLISPKTMANIDSEGNGPSIRISMGKKKVAYDVDSFIKWLETRVSPK